jgi:hypothetical protein
VPWPRIFLPERVSVIVIRKPDSSKNTSTPPDTRLNQMW